MVRKQVGLKTGRSAEVARRVAEKRRKNAERKRVTAESGRKRAETVRKAAADKFRNEEEQRKTMEELRRTAEDMRQIAEKIRQSSLVGIETQERMRETAELIQGDRVQGFIEEAHQSMNKLYQEAIEQLKEMKKTSNSAKTIFQTMEEMLRKTFEQLKTPPL